MNKSQMKVAGIACLVVCAICIFVAVERYQANANAVNAMNSMGRGFLGAPGLPGSSGMPGMPGNLTPATPTATLYAGFFCVAFRNWRRRAVGEE